MSIQSEITRISGNVSDALDAIERKGVTIPAGATSDDLADLIDQIDNGLIITDSLDAAGGIVRTMTAANVERSHEILNPTVTPYGTNSGTVTATGRRCGDVVSITVGATPYGTVAPGAYFARATLSNIPLPYESMYAVSLADTSTLIAQLQTNGRVNCYSPVEHVGNVDTTYTRYFTFTYIYRGDE